MTREQEVLNRIAAKANTTLLENCSELIQRQIGDVQTMMYKAEAAVSKQLIKGWEKGL